MVFFEDVRICIGNLNILLVYFVYCLKGNLLYSFGMLGVERKLKKFQIVIVLLKENEDNILFFEKNINIKVILIVVGIQNVDLFENNFFNYKVKEIFFEKNFFGNFFYVGFYNLKIVEKIEELNVVIEIGIV